MTALDSHVPSRRRRGLVQACAMAMAVLAPSARPVAGADLTPPLEDVQVAHWTTAEGLPQNTVNDLVALPGGELWLATFGGLVRFDGARFQVVDIAGDDGLPSNRITALEPAGADALWFVSQDGHLGRLEGGRARTLVEPAPRMRDVLGLKVAGGDIYSQTADGTVWHTDGRSRWRSLFEAADADAGGLNFLAGSAGGETWVSLKRAVAQLHGGAVARRVALPAGSLSLAAARPGELWVGLEHGVARLVNDRLERLVVRPAIDGPVTVVLPVSGTEIWVAGAGHVSHLARQPDGTWARRALPLALPQGVFMRALLLDRDGSLWIGTTGHGLYRAHRHPARRYGEAAGLGAIQALVSDDSGGAWVSSSCTGIYRISEAGAVTLVHGAGETATEELGGCEHAFAPDGHGALWVRSHRDLYRIERAPHRLRKSAVELPDEPGPIAITRDGTLWIASRDGTVLRVANERVVERLQLPAPLISAVVAPDDSVWLGGRGVVFHLRGGARQRIGAEQGVPRGAVRDLLVGADGSVLIATYGGGLGYLRDGRATRITSQQGLPDNALTRVLDDGRGRLWISTNRGIAVVERAEIEAVARGTRRVIAPVLLGGEHGVPEANSGLPAGFVDRRGHLWFGTIAGVVRIEASKFPFNTTPPRVRIEGVTADDRALPLGRVVEIPAETSRVRLLFGAVALLYPERLRFRFRFEGIDRDWVDVGAQRFTTWTPSGPGRQRFLLQARNEDGVWSTAPVVIELQVLPAWWQTRAARYTGLAAGLIAAFFLYRLRVSALERRHARQVTDLEERRRVQEQAMSLRAQLEHVSRVALAGELAASLAHEVNQPLMAIVANAEAAEHLVAGDDAPGATEIADILKEIVAQGMRASEVIAGLRGFLRAGTPEPATLDLSALVRDILPLVRRELEDHRVEVQLELADSLPKVAGRHVQLGQIVLNLVMNACEALAQVGGPRRITIATAARDGRVEMTVRDNGPGLAPEVAERLFDPFVSTKPQGMGMGLAICRSIAEAHHGRLTAEPVPDGGLAMILSIPATAAPTAIHGLDHSAHAE